MSKSPRRRSPHIRTRMKLGATLLTERQAFVLQLRQEEGMTYREIAARIGVTHHRVQQILAEVRTRMREHEENPQESLVLLPKRVRTMLENIEFGSRSEVLEAVQAGRLYYDEKGPANWNPDRAQMKRTGINAARLRNAGRGTWEILLQWLGLRTADGHTEER